MIRLQWLDYLGTLRERKTWLCGAMMAYAVVAVPFILARPPEHVQVAIATWFGADDPFVLFMYVWVDVVMNKVIAFVPVVMASGLVLRERDTGALPVLASKPLSMGRYFALKTVSACAVVATLHVGTQLTGLVYFTVQFPGFRPLPFVAAMVLHLFAAVFATAFAAAIAGWVKRRSVSALIGFSFLGALVGLALVGYYQPAWRAVTMLNPITLGSLALGDLDRLGTGALLPPMVALSVLTAAMMGLGALGMRRLEA